VLARARKNQREQQAGEETGNGVIRARNIGLTSVRPTGVVPKSFDGREFLRIDT
jgi:hypothetical protein